MDSSVVVDVLVDAPGRQVLSDRLATEELHVPTLIDSELVSAVSGLVLGGRLTPGRAVEALADYDQLPLRRWSLDHALRSRMFSLRDRATAYDAAYAALAEALQCPLLTRDARLARSVTGLVDVELR